MRGGARARSGPPPDPNALRRDRRDDKEWIDLPREGRKGTAPDWPLLNPTERELEIWKRLWRRPQAVEWERNGQELEVAVFVRTFVEAEEPGAAKGKRDLVRQGMEALGLSIPGLLRNHWRIGKAPAEDAPSRGTPGAARQRFKVVQGGAS